MTETIPVPGGIAKFTEYPDKHMTLEACRKVLDKRVQKFKDRAPIPSRDIWNSPISYGRRQLDGS